MSNVDTGSISGFSDGAVPAHLKAGGGLNAATRAVQQSKQPIHISQPSSFTPSFPNDGKAPSIFNQSAASWADTGYSEADWHADLRFWGWEDTPSAGSGYMH